MKFIAEDSELTIKLQGFEKVFGLKSSIVIPKGVITDLQWQPQLTFTERIWRLAGSGIPGVLYAGHFRAGGNKYFLYLHQPKGIAWVNGSVVSKNTLLITTQDYNFKQLLFTCTPEIGAELINWWQGTTAPVASQM